ncbi:hypothetical protein FACS1894219_08320 [Clostridia bacterium]|nr:hypothetical protein FACS1894219_08320 [Clostridia bacterium]
MPGVSKEQIARAKEIGIEEYILSHEPNNVKRIGQAYYLRDHDSLKISNGLWNWHSRGIGGKNVIDYLIKVRGYDFVGAVRHLAGDDYSITQPRAAPKSKLPFERKTFILPPRNTNNDRIIAYLQSRGIDSDIIESCVNRGSLYETATFHNCCFVGRDENGKAREDKNKVDEAADFLTELLSEGDVPANEAIELADEAGISKRTLERARATLDVKAKRVDGHWVWSM